MPSTFTRIQGLFSGSVEGNQLDSPGSPSQFGIVTKQLSDAGLAAESQRLYLANRGMNIVDEIFFALPDG